MANGHDTQVQHHQQQHRQEQQQQLEKQQALGKAMGSLSQDATASFDWSSIGEPSASDCNVRVFDAKQCIFVVPEQGLLPLQGLTGRASAGHLPVTAMGGCLMLSSGSLLLKQACCHC